MSISTRGPYVCTSASCWVLVCSTDDDDDDDGIWGVFVWWLNLEVIVSSLFSFSCKSPLSCAPSTSPSPPLEYDGEKGHDDDVEECKFNDMDEENNDFGDDNDD